MAAGHRVRVGYLSPDFREHSVVYFIESVLQHHDRERFEVYCYQSGAQDAITARVKARVEHWRSVGGISNEELEQVLRADELDILVELSGHTQGNKLEVLARRIAPVQVTYLGCPNTTGVPSIDYRITDARADPPGDADALHVEKLFRLPETFLCYAPPVIGGETGETPPSPVHRNGHITFASFNNVAKISPVTIRLWSRILASVPDSRLLIKSRGFQDPGLRSLLLSRFSEQGIDPRRIAVMEPIVHLQAHLQAYRGVDIGLDSFPYHGTTTTMEALWMGVPVVTLAGDRHASRVGVSILSTLGLTDLVAQTEDEYVAIAARLAVDIPALDALRQSLHSRLIQSPLTDGARFTAQLEQAYRQMWQEVLIRPTQNPSTRAAGA
jgi:predicted O-linked N-acetylglucosamine transferase (SPINDLY family)